MSLSYREFVQRIKTEGVARQNRFSLDLPMPPGMQGRSSLFASAGGEALRTIQLLCKSVSVPGINVASAPYYTVGEAIEAPYSRTFSGATMTFYVDSKMYVRKMFDEWMDLIQDPTTRSMGYYQDFVTNATVNVEDIQNNIRYTIVLYDLFLKNIGAISLDQGANDIMTLDVTFDYHYYRTFLSGKAYQPTSSTSEYNWDASPAGLYSKPGSETGPKNLMSSLFDNSDIISQYRNDFMNYQQEYQRVNSQGSINGSGVQIGALGGGALSSDDIKGGLRVAGDVRSYIR